MKRILALAGKDLKLLLRDRVGFFFVFFFPLIYAVFFGVIFSGEGGGMGRLSLVVVDEDHTQASRNLIEKLEKAEELSVVKADRDEAESWVRQGKKSAYVILPAGFGAAKDQIFWGEGIRMEVGVDPGRKAEAGMIQGVLTQYAFQELQDIFRDRKLLKQQARHGLELLQKGNFGNSETVKALKRFLPEVDLFLTDLLEEEEENFGEEGNKGDSYGLEHWQPIKIDISPVILEQKGPQTAFDITLPQAFIWMFIGCSAAFGISIVIERTQGTLIRLRSSPVTLSQILAGKAFACLMTILAAAALLFVFFSLVFGVRPNSYPLLFLAVLASALAFVGVMMLFSVLGRTEASASGIGWAALMVMAMTGGGMLPLVMMPSWMQTVSHFSFIKWAVLAIEGAIWRGFSSQEMFLPCAILIGVGSVFFGLGTRLFRAMAD